MAEYRLERLAAAGRIRRISYAAFHYLITHGGGGPFASAAEARLIGAGPPRGAVAIRGHAEQVADVIIRKAAAIMKQLADSEALAWLICAHVG